MINEYNEQARWVWNVISNESHETDTITESDEKVWYKSSTIHHYSCWARINMLGIKQVLQHWKERDVLDNREILHTAYQL